MVWTPTRNTRFVFMRRDNGHVDAVIEAEPVFITHQVWASFKSCNSKDELGSQDAVLAGSEI